MVSWAKLGGQRARTHLVRVRRVVFADAARGHEGFEDVSLDGLGPRVSVKAIEHQLRRRVAS